MNRILKIISDSVLDDSELTIKLFDGAFICIEFEKVMLLGSECVDEIDIDLDNSNVSLIYDSYIVRTLTINQFLKYGPLNYYDSMV